MTPGDGLTLYTEAGALLTLCAALLDTLPDVDADLAGAPERRYVSPGPAILDCCAQLTVHLEAASEVATAPLTPPPAAGQRNVTGRLNQGGLTIVCGRCVPTPEPPELPDVALMEAAAKQILADAWCVWNGVYRAWRDKLIFSACDGVEFGQATPLAMAGGCGGFTMTVTPRLPGYAPAL